MISDIRDLVEEVPEVASSGMEASFRETLRGRAGYPADTAQGALAPYQPTLLSVPSDTSAAPYARAIVSSEARSYLDEIERMMRPVEQTDILDSLHGPIVPYVDPVLKRSRKHYVGFMQRLHKIGLAILCLDPAEFVGVFVVYKKGKKGIRLILDARKTNRAFAAAPSVSLLSTEGLCGSEVVGDRDAAGCGVAFAVGDIKDVFTTCESITCWAFFYLPLPRHRRRAWYHWK